MASSVQKKTAIVTGAGSGISLAFAELLLKSGCNVVFADLALRPEAVDVVSAYSLSTDTKARALFQQTDVTDWDQLSRLFSLATTEFGGVDIVCPGAGVYEPPFSSFWFPPESSAVSKDDPSQSRYKALDINLTHPIRCTQLAISHFLSQHPPKEGEKVPYRGTVVHISSIAAQVSPVFAPIYNATKAGLSHFIRSLAPLEDRFGIRVNGVAPGIIKTPLWTEHPEKLKMIDSNFDDWVTPQEVAQVMLDCIVGDDSVGGTILEIGLKQVRKVEVRNDPGPKGAGHELPSAGLCADDVWSVLGMPGWGINPS
ncbi:MAG: Superoxide dismutase [Cu-Zn] [Chaenotheca gracillima]|nr:MAG: Superoxide dismutase [Cu-Zn] [Chaenotheca gracillima]